MKYYIIAGEKSGDLHASNLMKALMKEDPEASFRFWGGDEMEKVGGEMVTHYRKMAFMGFWEVITHLGTIRKYLKACRADIAQWKPDALILVDYAGFNLRIASFAKRSGVKVMYYISPKVWAWNPKRALQVKKNVDHLFSILPFEKAFFKQYGFENVHYVGNPLFDAIENFTPDPDFLAHNKLDSAIPIIALLPGSRKQEVKSMLPVMLGVVDAFPHFQFVVAGVDNLPDELYGVANNIRVKVINENSYNILHHARLALVTSGTATLETALFNVPQAVCYKTSAVTYQIVKQLITVPYISLVNLVAEKEVVKEFIQHDLSVENLVEELKKLSGEKGTTVENGYAKIRQTLDVGTSVSQKAAGLMVQSLTIN